MVRIPQSIRPNQAILKAKIAKNDQTIISKDTKEKALSFKELFKNYDGSSFGTKIELPKRVGNEKW